MKITFEYDLENNIGSTHKGNYCIMTLDFNTDTFELFDDMTKEDANHYYHGMTIERKEYLSNTNWSDENDQKYI